MTFIKDGYRLEQQQSEFFAILTILVDQGLGESETKFFPTDFQMLDMCQFSWDQ